VEAGADVCRRDGVTQDDLRAFEYFSRIATSCRGLTVGAAAAIVANAFVSLGATTLNAFPIEGQGRPRAAREMFSYAASYSAMPCAIRSGAALFEDPRRLAG